MKNTFKWVGIAAVAVAAVLATVIKIDSASIIAVAVGAFGCTTLVMTLVTDAKEKTEKVRIETYVCAGCAALGGIGMAVGGLTENDITTVVSAVVTLVTVLISFKVASSASK